MNPVRESCKMESVKLEYDTFKYACPKETLCCHSKCSYGVFNSIIGSLTTSESNVVKQVLICNCSSTIIRNSLTGIIL